MRLLTLLLVAVVVVAAVVAQPFSPSTTLKEWLASCSSISTEQLSCLVDGNITIPPTTRNSDDVVLPQRNVVLLGKGVHRSTLDLANSSHSVVVPSGGTLTLENLGLRGVLLSEVPPASSDGSSLIPKAFSVSGAGAMLVMHSVEVILPSCSDLILQQAAACHASPSPNFTVLPSRLIVHSLTTARANFTDVVFTCSGTTAAWYTPCIARTVVSGTELIEAIAGPPGVRASADDDGTGAIRGTSSDTQQTPHLIPNDIALYLYVPHHISLAGAVMPFTGPSGRPSALPEPITSTQLIIGGPPASAAGNKPAAIFSAPAVEIDLAGLPYILPLHRLQGRVMLRDITLTNLPYGSSTDMPDSMLSALVWTFDVVRKLFGARLDRRLVLRNVRLRISTEELAMWMTDVRLQQRPPAPLDRALCAYGSNGLRPMFGRLVDGVGGNRGPGLWVVNASSFSNLMELWDVLLTDQPSAVWPAANGRCGPERLGDEAAYDCQQASSTVGGAATSSISSTAPDAPDAPAVSPAAPAVSESAVGGGGACFTSAAGCGNGTLGLERRAAATNTTTINTTIIRANTTAPGTLWCSCQPAQRVPLATWDATLESAPSYRSHPLCQLAPVLLREVTPLWKVTTAQRYISPAHLTPKWDPEADLDWRQLRVVVRQSVAVVCGAEADSFLTRQATVLGTSTLLGDPFQGLYLDFTNCASAGISLVSPGASLTLRAVVLINLPAAALHPSQANASRSVSTGPSLYDGGSTASGDLTNDGVAGAAADVGANGSLGGNLGTPSPPPGSTAPRSQLNATQGLPAGLANFTSCVWPFFLDRAASTLSDGSSGGLGTLRQWEAGSSGDDVTGEEPPAALLPAASTGESLPRAYIESVTIAVPVKELGLLAWILATNSTSVVSDPLVAAHMEWGLLQRSRLAGGAATRRWLAEAARMEWVCDAGAGADAASVAAAPGSVATAAPPPPRLTFAWLEWCGLYGRNVTLVSTPPEDCPFEWLHGPGWPTRLPVRCSGLPEEAPAAPARTAPAEVPRVPGVQTTIDTTTPAEVPEEPVVACGTAAGNTAGMGAGAAGVGTGCLPTGPMARAGDGEASGGDSPTEAEGQDRASTGAQGRQHHASTGVLGAALGCGMVLIGLVASAVGFLVYRRSARYRQGRLKGSTDGGAAGCAGGGAAVAPVAAAAAGGGGTGGAEVLDTKSLSYRWPQRLRVPHGGPHALKAGVTVGRGCDESPRERMQQGARGPRRLRGPLGFGLEPPRGGLPGGAGCGDSELGGDPERGDTCEGTLGTATCSDASEVFFSAGGALHATCSDEQQDCGGGADAAAPAAAAAVPASLRVLRGSAAIAAAGQGLRAALLLAHDTQAPSTEEGFFVALDAAFSAAADATSKDGGGSATAADQPHASAPDMTGSSSGDRSPAELPRCLSLSTGDMQCGGSCAPSGAAGAAGDSPPQPGNMAQGLAQMYARVDCLRDGLMRAAEGALAPPPAVETAVPLLRGNEAPSDNSRAQQQEHPAQQQQGVFLRGQRVAALRSPVPRRAGPSPLSATRAGATATVTTSPPSSASETEGAGSAGSNAPMFQQCGLSTQPPGLASPSRPTGQVDPAATVSALPLGCPGQPLHTVTAASTAAQLLLPGGPMAGPAAAGSTAMCMVEFEPGSSRQPSQIPPAAPAAAGEGALWGISALRLVREVSRGAQVVTYRGVWRELDVAVKSFLFMQGDAGTPAGGPLSAALPAAASGTGAQDSRGDAHAAARRALQEAALSLCCDHRNIVATYTHSLQSLTVAPGGPICLVASQQQQQQQGLGRGAGPDSLSQSLGGMESLLGSESGLGLGQEGEEEGEEEDAAGPVPLRVEAWRLVLVQEYCDGNSLRTSLLSGALAQPPLPTTTTVPNPCKESTPSSTRTGPAPTAAAPPAPAAPRPPTQPPLRVALLLALDVARGMSHLHRCGVVHGDLSSSTVLLARRPPRAPQARRLSALPMFAALAASASLTGDGDGRVPTGNANCGSEDGNPIGDVTRGSWRASPDGKAGVGGAQAAALLSAARQRAAVLRRILEAHAGGSGSASFSGGVSGGGGGTFGLPAGASGGGGGVAAAGLVQCRSPSADALRAEEFAREEDSLSDGCRAAWGLEYIAKVCDFGLAGRLTGQDQTHLSGPTRRFSLYSAPELALDGSSSKATDVYAFGVLLWELASGLPLPEALQAAPQLRTWLAEQAKAASLRALHMAVVVPAAAGASPPAPPAALPPVLLPWPPGLPPEYLALVGECLGEAPAERPAFAAVCARLEEMVRAAMVGFGVACVDGDGE